MSALEVLRDTSMKLHDIHERARDRWKTNGDVITGEEDGVQVVMKYEWSNRNTDYRTVLLDGHMFARESETIPWNIFKSISVGYTVFLDLSLESATDFISLIKPVGKVDLREEWYPPLDKEPMYFAHCNEFADVIALWKLWKPKYLNHHE
jgi:hypothetical protein